MSSHIIATTKFLERFNLEHLDIQVAQQLQVNKITKVIKTRAGDQDQFTQTEETIHLNAWFNKEFYNQNRDFCYNCLASMAEHIRNNHGLKAEFERGGFLKIERPAA